MMTNRQETSFNDLELLDNDVLDIGVVQKLNTNFINIMTQFRHMSLKNSFDSQLVENVKIPNGETLRINHNLKVVPESRIITRIVGAGLISDGVFNNKYIELKNNGPEDVTLSVIILKG